MSTTMKTMGEKVTQIDRMKVEIQEKVRGLDQGIQGKWHV